MSTNTNTNEERGMEAEKKVVMMTAFPEGDCRIEESQEHGLDLRFRAHGQPRWLLIGNACQDPEGEPNAHGMHLSLDRQLPGASPQMVRNLTVPEVVLVVVGGLLYTVGAFTLAFRWPDPFPRVFGYHEVWHTLVVIAVVCQFVALASVIVDHAA